MILSVENASFHYPGNHVLDNIHFKVQKGEFVAILGTNGTGKSTLLKCMNRILPLNSGTVYIEQKCSKAHTLRELAQKLSYMEQHRVGKRMQVFDSVLLGRKPYIEWHMRDEDIQISEEALAAMNMQDYAMRYLDELSGGELQKVVIARTIAQQPKVMLMDEPTNHLDLKNQLEVLSTVRKMVDTRQISAIVAMHDLNLALRYADSFIFMKDKRIHAAGGKKILTPQLVEEVYAVPVSLLHHEGYTFVLPK
ncbi:MAG: ABC transporter ATP-binding protein [Mesobacillus sp.]